MFVCLDSSYISFPIFSLLNYHWGPLFVSHRVPAFSHLAEFQKAFSSAWNNPLLSLPLLDADSSLRLQLKYHLLKMTFISFQTSLALFLLSLLQHWSSIKFCFQGFCPIKLRSRLCLVYRCNLVTKYFPKHLVGFQKNLVQRVRPVCEGPWMPGWGHYPPGDGDLL